MSAEVTLSLVEAEDLALRACKGAGAGEATARSLAKATLSAIVNGRETLGFPHLLDYLNSFREGRIKCDPNPLIEKSYPAFLVSDADGGIAQFAFDNAFDDLVAIARQLGVAILAQRNGYTAGELGYYVRRLAEQGLVAIAATNANSLMVAQPGGRPVYSTNPLAFAFPLGDGERPLVIDQAMSSTAYVNIVAAANEGRPIPEGWAVDGRGQQTTDASAALAGSTLR